MTPTTVQRRRRLLDRLQTVLRADEAKLQNECAHPAASKKYGASTGNYDPSADGYWIDWNCPDCGKHWSTDQ